MAKDVDVIFISGVAVSGFLNGVVNLALETTHWLPVQDGDTVKVASASEVTANLRFDLYAAQQIHEALGRIIESNTKPAVTN